MNDYSFFMYQSNEKLHLAEQYVHYTHKNIFLTGKAGTGKTTFLKTLQKNCPKRMAIVAPTGVAAINAGGVTIHSFFQLHFGPIVPGQLAESGQQRKFSSEKIAAIKAVDLLVIDEISMVRADLLDGIDQVLRRYRDGRLAFGGVQLLMIGDLHQLAPVVKEEEWRLIQQHYASPYFFESMALKQSDFVSIELTHIFRQQDETFINLLNKVRDKQLDTEAILMLNSRYKPQFVPAPDEEYITLTTHNLSAQQLNQQKLSELPSKSFHFKAEIHDDFPEHMYPNDANLELKLGAQIMFVKNDSSREKRYFNGKIGQITHLSEDEIHVSCKDDEEEIVVRPETWQNIKYVLNQNKQLEEQIIGEFIQMPIKTAWAITIHKSQGLTFDRAIIDAQASFAHGQVYVALSRCKSFEGLVLTSPIQPASVKSDHTIASFNHAAQAQNISSNTLDQAKKETQSRLIKEQFDFAWLQKNLHSLAQAVKAADNHLPKHSLTNILAIQQDYDTQIGAIPEKFQAQLDSYFVQDLLPEQNEALQERVKKGSIFLGEILKERIFQNLLNLDLEADNKEIKKALVKNLDYTLLQVFEKIKVLEASQHGFETTKYIQAKANAGIDIEQAKAKHSKEKADKKAPTDAAKNNALYQMLKNWRDQKAEELDTEHYMVLPIKTMQSLADTMPGSLASLREVHGMGKAKIERYGAEILEIIKQYAHENALELHVSSPQAVKKDKSENKANTFEQSLKLYQEGMNIAEIAEHRAMSPGTIEGHLAKYVEEGKLEVSHFVPKDILEKIISYFRENPDARLGTAKEHFGDTISYSHLKFAKAAWLHHNA